MLETCFVNTDQKPIKVEHLSWSVQQHGKELRLIEHVRETYSHPDAPDCAYITLVTYHLRETMDKEDYRAASLVVLRAAQQTVSQIFRENNQ